MTDVYLYFHGPDVAGDSQDSENIGAIEIMSFSFGSDMPTTDARSYAGSGTTGKVHMSDFSFVKSTDSASVPLMKHCWIGTHFEKVLVKCYRAHNTGRIEYLNILLESCVVSDFLIGASSGVPTESVMLNYGKISLKYTDSEKLSGKGSANKQVIAYDRVQNLAG
ncbi:MAG: type VI secretion system tube protein Hcp [Candidatus Kapaibacterium sp.]|nr:type VI secretion system tube protein Hcp [Bacteroidota bacterium]